MPTLGPRLLKLKFGFAMLMVAAGAAAQTASTGAGPAYPAKPVRLLIPFSAGSGSDTIGRIYAGGMAEALGQQMIVENRAGAAGNIGAEIAARAPADGYTLLMVNMAHAVNVTMYRKRAYDPTRDFTPVSLAATEQIRDAVNEGSAWLNAWVEARCQSRRDAPPPVGVARPQVQDLDVTALDAPVLGKLLLELVVAAAGMRPVDAVPGPLAGERRGLGGDPLLQVTVGDDREDAMIDDGVPWLVELSG